MVEEKKEWEDEWNRREPKIMWREKESMGIFLAYENVLKIFVVY